MTRRELLRHPGLLGLLARDVVSLTGSQMTMLALPWFVLTTTGSAARMAVVLAVESASAAIFGYLSGNLATRLGPRRTMLIADSARAPLVALIPLLHVLDALSFPLLLVLAAAIAAFATPSFAAKSSILPDLIGEDESVVAEANALLQAASRITLFAGPALAGVLIAAIGATNVLLIDAVSFALGTVIVALFVHGAGRVEQDQETRGLSAGFRFLARDRLLRPWSIAIVVGDVGWMVMFAAMPVLVLERFGEDPALLGWIWGAFGLGAVLGNVISFRTVAKSDRLLISSVGEVFMIAPLWFLLTDVPELGVVAVMALSGFANGIVNPPIHTIFLLRTPRALRAKMWSVIIAATTIAGPVALAAAGPVLDSDGFVPVVLTLVAVQTLAAVAFTTAGLRERARVGEVVPA
jgi:predicted MFS family arabinose efflux permease